MNPKKQILPLVLFLIGFAITIVGALFKIQHWPYGSEILTLGMFLKVVAVIIFIISLIKFSNKEDKTKM